MVLREFYPSQATAVCCLTRSVIVRAEDTSIVIVSSHQKDLKKLNPNQANKGKTNINIKRRRQRRKKPRVAQSAKKPNARTVLGRYAKLANSIRTTHNARRMHAPQRTLQHLKKHHEENILPFRGVTRLGRAVFHLLAYGGKKTCLKPSINRMAEMNR